MQIANHVGYPTHLSDEKTSLSMTSMLPSFMTSVLHCFAHIHVDVVLPVPTSQGHRYLFTVIDRSTRPEAIPMKTATSTSCTSALLSGWIARFAIPEPITSNRSALFAIVDIIGKYAGNHPTSDNHLQPFCQQSDRSFSLYPQCLSKESNWFTKFPWLLLGIRTTPEDSLDMSAAEMVYSDPFVVPAVFFPSATSSDNLSAYLPLWENLFQCRQTYKPSAKQHILTSLHLATH
ncbi:uncharacterized protein [Palaemon carinicauda]|uniref:uncharacterized protein n=1 Tax=Palaemon carinicauda TaxID=392227 RepID=UPI0035B592E8